MYAIKYSKENYESIESVCSEFTWDYLSDYIPHYLSEFINYHKFITETFKDVEIEETSSSYIFLSGSKFEELQI